MNKSVLWIIICALCVVILLGAGSLFKYEGNKLTLDIPIRVYNHNEYANWEELEIKANPDYENLGIFIDINAKTLELINMDNNEVIRRYSIATGKADTPSPIGSWTIVAKARWGKGFGTRWMGLNVPWGTYQYGIRSYI